MSWKSNEYHLAINMAGAVSAGAYTAGVLDFLVEALEEWQKEKDAFRAQLANAVPGAGITNAVPLHEVRIDAMSGASAGGMCAAIASVMVQGDFQHIRTGDETGTNNTFYEGWVNSIDIREFLKTDDVSGGAPLVSLLDSTILDTIADKALVLGAPNPKPFIAPDLTLFMTMTNVRGVCYPLYVDAALTLEEHSAYYGDRLRFEVVPVGSKPGASAAKPLPLDKSVVGAWPLLKEAAKATGAFPIFLAPRKLTRDLSDYIDPPWAPLCSTGVSAPVVSDLPPAPPLVWETLNVDGGLTDNDPFQLAHDFLAANNNSVNKPSPCSNPTDSNYANCSVISVAPFPAVEQFAANYFPSSPGQNDPTNIFTMIGKLFSVLLSQSRFMGESLAMLTSGTSFSRFVIAPSDPSQQNSSALQGSTLGAFGGFLDRGFRKHDFLLGRRNCQRFLDTNFVLPVTSTVIAAGLAEAGAYSGSVQQLFKRVPPNAKAPPQDQIWIPIIPLCGSARVEAQQPTRAKISESNLDQIVGLVFSRFDGVKGPLLQNAPWIVKFLVGAATTWPFSLQVKGKIKDTLKSSLGINIA